MSRSNQPGFWGQPQYPNTSVPDFGGDLTDLANSAFPLMERRFPTLLDLSNATGMQEGYTARVDTIPGHMFVYIAGQWITARPGVVATTQDRNAVFTGGRGPINGDKVYVENDGCMHKYLSTKVGATTSAGWVRVGRPDFSTAFNVNSGGGLVGPGTNRNYFQLDRTILGPADCVVFTEAKTYLANGTYAGQIATRVNGVEFGIPQGNMVRRIHNHNYPGLQSWNLWNQVALGPGANTITLNLAADGASATFELWDVQGTCQIIYK